MASIETGACYIGSLLRDGKEYHVPDFQRDYSWDLEQIQQLWDDILRTISDKEDSYFIGSVVINDSNPSAYKVIDGQQRLTTISILMAALRDAASEAGEADLSGPLATHFLGKFDFGSGATRPKLTLNVANRQYYQDRIINNPGGIGLSSDKKSKSVTRSNRLIAQAYLFFQEAIRNKISTGVSLRDLISQVVKAVDDVLQVIRIQVKDDYDAYMLFETLNDRGLALSVSDLLKNYLFSKAGDHRADVKDNWEHMAIVLKDVEIKRFLRHFWNSKYSVVRDRDLFGSIKNKYDTKQRVVAFSKELRNSADLYAALSDPDAAVWSDFSDRDRQQIRDLIEQLTLFGVTQYHALLIAVLDANPSIFVSVFRTVVVFAYRYSIIMGSGTGNIEKAFSSAALYVRQHKSCSAKDVFTKIQSLYPDDEGFEREFAEKSITVSALARYTLRKLNDKMVADSGMVTDANAFSVNLEHILPQKYVPDEWREFLEPGDDSDLADYVYRLGNMTLLSSALNRKISNGGFSKKKPHYSTGQPFRISDQVVSADNWTAEAVVGRQRAMARLAKHVWRVDF